MPRKIGKEKISKNHQKNKLLKIRSFLTKFFKAKKTKSTNSSKDELKTAQNLVAEEGIISNFDGFSDKTAEDVMIPRSDISAVSADISIDELCKIIVSQGHTRTLVYQESLDNIIGFVHIKDLFEAIVLNKKSNLVKLIRRHIISPHSMKLIDLLTQMQLNRTHIAVVVDEYGGTDGIVTIEDIIEEIVGRIDDEHDDIEVDSYKIIKPGIVIVNSRLEVEQLEEIIAIKLKEEGDDFDTVGGLIMAKCGSVPEKGRVVEIRENIEAEILDATPRTIKQIKITYRKKHPQQ
jgi:CBS domain containing-hemolysin-like protein